MRRPWWISATLGWVAVVAVVALVTWWVIDSAGEEVLAESGSEVAPPVTTSLPSTDASRPTDRPTKDRTERTDGPGTAGTGSSAPTPSGVPTTSVPPPTTTPAAPPASAEQTEQAPVRRTASWQGPEGIVRVSCTGSDLRLEGASPASGYEVDTSTRHSGSELEVRFRSSDGDREVEVIATCVGGAPQFRTERD